MKVLFISPYLTMRNIGASVGSWSHLNAIRNIVGNENVIAVALRFDMNNYVAECDGVQIIDSYKNKWEKYGNIFTLNGICMNQRVRNQILQIIENNDIDIVFLDESTLGRLAKQIRRKYKNIKIISFYHDIKAYLCKQWIKNGGVKTVPYNLGLMYNEWINARNVDTNVVLNARDNQLFQQKYGKPADHFLPHFIKERKLDLDSYNRTQNNKIILLFVGADYTPNIEGITWFIDNVMPKLTIEHELWIVGRNMENKASLFEHKCVKVIGTVQNLDDWYLKSDIIISPIFSGGGMKTKTAEAYQYGKRIIATSESYEGYTEYIPETFWGKYCWKADTADEFISAINSIQRSDVEVFNHEINQVFIDSFSDHAGESRLRRILGVV